MNSYLICVEITYKIEIKKIYIYNKRTLTAEYINRELSRRLRELAKPNANTKLKQNQFFCTYQ